jgi:NTP pyrophosphatase (non-canonical NTP hydrolase)
MDFQNYQEQASKTIQKSSLDEKLSSIVPFLGIIGEIGSVLTQLKIKLRDGKSYKVYEQKLSEELGDVLWYLSTIATQNSLSLDVIASKNLDKINDRFMVDENTEYIDFDLNYPEHERFPEEFEIMFKS